MKGLNRTSLIKKYRNKKQLYAMRDGGSVIGQEVDADNRLVYIVKRSDGSVDVALAENERVIHRITQSSKQVVKRHISLSSKQTEEPIEGAGKKTSK